MSRISDKIAYTANAIDDIQAALEERGFDMDGIALRLYGGLIRSIKTSSYYEEIIDEDGFAHNIIRNRFDNAIIINNLNDDRVHYIFDAGVYPNRLILNTLYDTDTQFQSVYMKKLTSWNGLVQYNNVYDVSTKIESSYENISKITTNSVYTINGNQYYCPGTAVTPYIRWGVHDYRRPLYLFKL